MAAEDEIADLQRRWMDAWVARDEAVLESALAPEFTLRSVATDALVDRAEWLEQALSGRVAGTAFRYADMRVQVLGDTAIVDSLLEMDATIAGRPWAQRVFCTDVWLRREGRWQVVRRHGSAPTGHAG